MKKQVWNSREDWEKKTPYAVVVLPSDGSPAIVEYFSGKKVAENHNDIRCSGQGIVCTRRRSDEIAYERLLTIAAQEV